jgi:hypothetical protein
MSDLLSRLHPSVTVRFRRDELHVTGATEFRAAPVIWFNQRGQVAAIGAGDWDTDPMLQRVGLLDNEGCFRVIDDQRSPPVLFLRYALAMVRRNQWTLAPLVIFVDEICSSADTTAAIERRYQAFSRAAVRAGAWRVERGA